MDPSEEGKNGFQKPFNFENPSACQLFNLDLCCC